MVWYGCWPKSYTGLSESCSMFHTPQVQWFGFQPFSDIYCGFTIGVMILMLTPKAVGTVGVEFSALKVARSLGVTVMRCSRESMLNGSQWSNFQKNTTTSKMLFQYRYVFDLSGHKSDTLLCIFHLKGLFYMPFLSMPTKSPPTVP